MKAIIHIAALGSLAISWQSSAAEGTAFPFLGYHSEQPGLKLSSLVSDGNQQVWAFANERGCRLYRLDQKKWRTIELDNFPIDLKPIALERNAEGNLIGLWESEGRNNEYFFSQHDGDRHSILAHFSTQLSRPVLLPLRNGRVAVTESGPKVIFFDPDRNNGEAIINTIAEDQFVAPKKSRDGTVSTGYLPIRAIEDHQGILWLWSHSMKEADHLWRLKFPLMLTGDGSEPATLSPLKLPETVPEGSPISPAVDMGDKAPAFGVPNIGFFTERFDPANSGLPENVFIYVEKIFPALGSWYFISTPRPTKLEVGNSSIQNTIAVEYRTFYEPGEESSTLLRLRDGEFTTVTRMLDREPRFGWLDRPVVEMADGFWTCIYPNALAYVSSNGSTAGESVKYLDQQAGLPLRFPSEIEKLNEKEIVVLDRSAGTTCLVSLENAFSQSNEKLRLSVIKTRTSLIDDASGLIHGVLSNGKFSIWRDSAWHECEVPDEEPFHRKDTHFMHTNRSHGWLYPYRNGPTAVCEFASGKWTTFESLEAALVAFMPTNSRLEGGDYPSMMPFSSAEAPPKISFIDFDGILKLFKNKRWYEWPLTDISGGDRKVTGTPFFRDDGTLVVPLGHRFWVLEDNDTWVQEKKQGDHPPEATYRGRDHLKLPADCPVSNVASAIYDRHGICWLRDTEGGLWKSLPGCTVPLLDERDFNDRLLLKSQRFYYISTDPLGNAFIRTEFSQAGSGAHLLFKTRYPLPDNRPGIIRIKNHALTLDLGKAPWKRWRINNGEWSRVTDANETTIEQISSGEHQIEILAYNEELTPTEESAILDFSITAVPGDKLSGLLDQLRNGNLKAREDAAVQLQSMGSAILDRLRSASRTADSTSYHWWLRAVIQRIEAEPPTAASAINE